VFQTYPSVLMIQHGVPLSGFAPNIAIVDEAYDGSVEDYLAACLGLMEKSIQGFKVLEKMPFNTDSGIKGIKFVFESKPDGKQLIQTPVLLQGN